MASRCCNTLIFYISCRYTLSTLLSPAKGTSFELPPITPQPAALSAPNTEALRWKQAFEEAQQELKVRGTDANVLLMVWLQGANARIAETAHRLNKEEQTSAELRDQVALERQTNAGLLVCPCRFTSSLILLQLESQRCDELRVALAMAEQMHDVCRKRRWRY